MEWQFCELNGEVSKTPTDFQVDLVGNIYQRTGGVVPKVCQQCKGKFDSKVEQIPIVETVPYFKCLECEFQEGNPSAALDHKLLTDHKLKKFPKERIAGYKDTLVGLISIVTKTEDDVIIVCNECAKIG